MRSIEKLGGLDAFMLKAKSTSMSIKAKRLKREITKKVTGAA